MYTSELKDIFHSSRDARMKLSEIKARLKALESTRDTLRAEAKKLYNDASAAYKTANNAEGISAEDLKNVTAKFDEAGRTASEINALTTLIAMEEGNALPNPLLGKTNLASQLNFGADNFNDFTRHVRGATGQPRFIRCDGNPIAARRLAYRFGVWMASLAAKVNPGHQAFGWAAKKWDEIRGDAADDGFGAVHQEDGMTGGSYLVPPEFLWEIITLRELFGTFRRNARVLPMTRDTLSIPRRVSGLTYYWVGEGGQITTSQKVWDQVKLVAKKLGALGVCTTELIEDAAVNIGDDLMGEIAYAFSSGEDDAGWLGDGTSTYGGITGVGNKLTGLSGTVSSISGLNLLTGTGAWTGNVLADFNTILGLLPQYADTPAVRWFASRTYYFGTMQRVASAAGGVTFTEIIDGVRKQMMLGYPVEFVQKLPRFWAVSQVPVLFGDLGKAAKMGDRRDIRIEQSKDATIDGVNLFTNDMLAYRGTERIDIVVHDVGNATATAASKQPGPIVGGITATT